jgi:hypothetical protein
MKKIKIIKKDPAAVWHGGRNLPPYRSAAGSWRRPPCPAAGTRLLPPCPAAVGT